MAVNITILTSCKTVLLTSQQFITIARYRIVDRWPYFHWFSKSRDIDVTMSKHRPDSRNWRSRIFKTSNGYMWVEKVIYYFKKKNYGVKQNTYRLASGTTAVLFDPRTDLLPSACDFAQQICPRIKQNCCCPQTQSITV